MNPDATTAIDIEIVNARRLTPDWYAETPFVLWNQIGTNCTSTRQTPMTQNMYHMAEAIDRFRAMRSGTVASSPAKYCIAPQAMIETPKMASVRIMRQEFHAYSVPPHCSASRRLTIEGMSSTLPARSNRLAISSGLPPLGCLITVDGRLT